MFEETVPTLPELQFLKFDASLNIDNRFDLEGLKLPDPVWVIRVWQDWVLSAN